MTEILAVLSIAAATGLRLALPLLLIGVLYGPSLWSQVPLLSVIPPRIMVGCLVSWSFAELVLSKKPRIRRIFQSMELVLSPLVGAIAGITIVHTFNNRGQWHGLFESSLIAGVLGGVLALLIQLVQVGWLYRFNSPPLWVLFIQDFLCVCLVLFAFDAPREGGLIALLLLWLALRTSTLWRQWYLAQADPNHRRHPRRFKQHPD
ncbi:MAG: DUF4126 domain-containing protein [Cyanobacteria bacterium]|nr:DUF4126 domain-containing protein [Cyanobacteriota bacterium]MDA0866353.1 DUF4126 domain-containing protein [Cyanobacteriota bacterium]